ncbi:SPFH domain / Band 7 family protein [Rubripirellula amarantea]|uniref:SPFH domain / Band 7 family protein n=1 Tax=Rubripirellula amarantea TaxID=2527999 RepID=A0A5C5WX38_9BACT|nr:SPFH domain-containing protein [Rubripirellula amarantea]TWT54553.1 SPFH domain / Band 7 family protein [Rubripirellula amarantea]
MSESSQTSSTRQSPLIHERLIESPMSAWVPLMMGLGCMLLAPLLFAMGVISGTGILAIPLAIVLGVAGFISLFGLMAIAPNDSRVLLLFGDYKGTVKKSGFFWVNPFLSKRKVSLRIRNFETGSSSLPEQKTQQGVITQAKSRTASRPSKVNDRDGNPIEISAVVVWKVVDTAEALFEVDDYEHYVEVQSEAALRSLATRYPYDHDDHEVSLRGNTDEICDQLCADIQERLGKAGVHVSEARISHLAYAPEIAAAMLQRQQAGAVVAARTKIVDGAVGMVEMALEHLKRDEIVELTADQRASLVSNLLVVLCSDRHTQPVVQAGS